MLSKSLIALLPLLITVSAAPHGGKRSCSARNGSSNALAYKGGSGSGSWTWGSAAQGSNTATIAIPSAAPVAASAASSADTAPVVSSAAPAVVSSAAGVAATTSALGDGAVASAPSSSNAAVIVSSAAVVAASSVAASSAASIAPVASSAAAAPSASSSSTTTTTTTTTTTSSGGAVGLGWGTNSGTDVASFGGKLSWYFNWDLSPSSNMGSLEFVPQVWGSGSVSGFTSSSIPSGTSHILSFNEPDQAASVGGSAIDAATAATLHQQWTAQVPSGILIGSPAVARGGNQWMDDWISACAGNCKYDFVAFHFYGTDANDLITYAQDFYTTYNKPLWLTEASSASWACQDYSTNTVCDAAQVQTFMQTAITWFEGDGASMVERWAWFGAFTDEASGGNANGLENADGSANALGTTYASL